MDIENDFNENVVLNFKKAVTMMLILHTLANGESYTQKIICDIREYSSGTIDLSAPYGAIIRLINAGFVTKGDRKKAPDGRTRVFYQITEDGRRFLVQQKSTYILLADGVENILRNSVEEVEE